MRRRRKNVPTKKRAGAGWYVGLSNSGKRFIIFANTPQEAEDWNFPFAVGPYKTEKQANFVAEYPHIMLQVGTIEEHR